MYFFDARSGRRRRALVRDQVSRAAHKSSELSAKAGRDLRNRANGLYQRSLSHFRPAANDDSVLAERIRAQIGRLSAHPGAIEVSCESGVVRLSGKVLAEELHEILAGVRSVRGVQEVINQLRSHEEPGSIPSLQGGAAGASRSSQWTVFSSQIV